MQPLPQPLRSPDLNPPSSGSLHLIQCRLVNQHWHPNSNAPVRSTALAGRIKDEHARPPCEHSARGPLADLQPVRDLFQSQHLFSHLFFAVVSPASTS